MRFCFVHVSNTKAYAGRRHNNALFSGSIVQHMNYDTVSCRKSIRYIMVVVLYIFKAVILICIGADIIFVGNECSCLPVIGNAKFMGATAVCIRQSIYNSLNYKPWRTLKRIQEERRIQTIEINEGLLFINKTTNETNWNKDRTTGRAVPKWYNIWQTLQQAEGFWRLRWWWGYLNLASIRWQRNWWPSTTDFKVSRNTWQITTVLWKLCKRRSIDEHQTRRNWLEKEQNDWSKSNVTSTNNLWPVARQVIERNTGTFKKSEKNLKRDQSQLFFWKMAKIQTPNFFDIVAWQ